MIVEPDFLDHWKTRLLVRLLGTELAPIYVIRLWAHCQQRKTDRFTGWKPVVLASVCRWDGDVETFWEAMGQTFVHFEDGAVLVHGWAETNASLVSAWANGKLGGRPKKPQLFAEEKPNGNRPGNPTKTDRVTDREDREDREEKIEKTKRFTPPTREEVLEESSKIGLPETEADKFLAYYCSNGWKVGKTPMKSWHHALAGWASRWKERSHVNGTNFGGRLGQLTAIEQRNSVISGAGETIAQSRRTAERERSLAETDQLPL